MTSEHKTHHIVSTFLSKVDSCQSLSQLCQLLENIRYPDEMGEKLLTKLKNTIRPLHNEILNDVSQRESFAVANFGLEMIPQPVLIHTFQFVGMKSLLDSMAVNKSLFQTINPSIYICYFEGQGRSKFESTDIGVYFEIYVEDEDSKPVTDKLEMIRIFKNPPSLEVLLEGWPCHFVDEWEISEHLFTNATHVHFFDCSLLDFCEAIRRREICLSNTTHIKLDAREVEELETSLFPNLTSMDLEKNFTRLQPNMEICQKIEKLSIRVELQKNVGHKFATNLQMFPSLKKLKIYAYKSWDKFEIHNSWMISSEVEGRSGFVESVQFDVDVANEDHNNKIVQVLTKFLKCKGILKQICVVERL